MSLFKREGVFREREVSGFRMNFNFVSQFQQKSAYNFALGKIMNS